MFKFFTTYPFAVPFVMAVGGIFFVIGLFLYKSLKKDIKDLSDKIDETQKTMSEKMADGQKNMSEKMADGQKNMSEKMADGQKNMSEKMADGQKNIKELFIAKLDPIERGLNNHVKTEIMKLREDVNKKIDDKFEKLSAKIDKALKKK